MSAGARRFAAIAIARAPYMALTFFASMALHTYLLSWVNDGFEKQSWASPYIHVAGNGTSATLIWTSLSALLWSFLFETAKRGPIGAATNLFQAPIARFSRMGAVEVSAAAMGAGAALIAAGLLPINRQAALSTGISWSLLGSSSLGRHAAQGLMRAWPHVYRAFHQRAGQRTQMTLRSAELIVAGIGPGFLIARFVPFAPLLLGSALVIIGAIRWARGLRDGLSQAGVFLVIVTGASAIAHLLASWLLVDDVWANDFGKREAGGTFGAWWKSPGRAVALGYGTKVAIGSAAGPLAPPLEAPENEERRRDATDDEAAQDVDPRGPSDEEKKAKFERDGVIWDPATDSWRAARAEDFPEPKDPPEGPPPYKKNHPRSSCPPECLSLYDQYAAAQASVSNGQADVDAAKSSYDRALQQYQNNVMKAIMVLGLDGGSALGGVVESAASSARPRARGRAGVHDPYSGPSGAFTAMVDRAKQAAARAAALAGRLAELAAEVARRARLVETLQNAALDMRVRIAKMRAALDGAVESAARLARLDAEADAAARRVSRAREMIRRLEQEADALRARIARLQAEKPKWDRWSKAQDLVDALKRETETVAAQKRQLDSNLAARLDFLARQRAQLAADIERLRDAGHLAEAETLKTQMQRLASQADDVKAEHARRQAALTERQRTANNLYMRAVNVLDKLEDKLDRTLDPAELPARESQLANNERSLALLHRELDEAVDAEARLNAALGHGGLDRLRRLADDARQRLADARRAIDAATADAEYARNRVALLEEQQPTWDAWSKAVDVADRLEKAVTELRERLSRARADRQRALDAFQAEVDKNNALRTSPGDPELAALKAREYENTLQEINARYDALEADLEEQVQRASAERDVAIDHEQQLSSQLDRTADPRELPDARRRAHRADAAREDAEAAFHRAIDDEAHATERLDRASADVAEAARRVAEARRKVESLTAEVESLRSTVDRLRAQQASLDAYESASARVKELENDLTNLRMEAYDLETAAESRLSALQQERAAMAARLHALRVDDTLGQIATIEGRIADIDREMARVRAEGEAAIGNVAAQLEAKHLQQDAALAEERALRADIDDRYDPRDLGSQAAELERTQAALDDAQRALADAEAAESPLARQIEDEKRAHPQSPSELSHEIEGLEESAAEAERRLADETRAHEAAKGRHAELERDLRAAQDEQAAAEAALRNLEPTAENAARTLAGDNPDLPLSQLLKPDWARQVEQMGGDFGAWVSSMVGGQSGEEMGDVLKRGEEQVTQARRDLAAAERRYDDALRTMRDVKPQLDACVVRYQPFDEGGFGDTTAT